MAGSAKKNEAFEYQFYLELTAGGPATGKSPTVQVSTDGAAFAGLTGAPAVTELATASGVYKVTVAAADMNADRVALKVTEAASVQQVRMIEMDNPLRIAAAVLANLLKLTVTTGVLQVYAEDGVTLLRTFTPGEVGGVVSYTPT